MIGDRLRQLRIETQLSQEKLAKELQVKPATVSRYENGTNEPDIKTIGWYAKRFGVSTDWIFGLTDDPTPYTPSAEVSQEADRQFNEAVDHEMTDDEISAILSDGMRNAMEAIVRRELEKQKKSEEWNEDDSKK